MTEYLLERRTFFPDSASRFHRDYHIAHITFLNGIALKVYHGNFDDSVMIEVYTKMERIGVSGSGLDTDDILGFFDPSKRTK